MAGLRITILDPDTSQAQRAAQRLRALLHQKGVLVCVQEVTCYLEISRQGLKDKTPIITVNDVKYQCQNLSDVLLERFAAWLARQQGSNL